MTTIKAVIFDFNGTLFKDTALHNEAWDIFLEKHAILLNHEEKNQKIHGKNNQDILCAIFEKDLREDLIHQYTMEKEKIYQDLCLKTNMQLTEGAEDLFRFLSSGNIPYTIATASGIENVDFYFQHMNLSEFFNYNKIIYNDLSMKSKPDPDLFIKAMTVLDARADETLIFEDSFSGIRAAENARVGKIIIVNSNNNNYDEWNYQVIHSFDEVDRNIFSKTS